VDPVTIATFPVRSLVIRQEPPSKNLLPRKRRIRATGVRRRNGVGIDERLIMENEDLRI